MSSQSRECKILLVDDEPYILEGLAHHLRRRYRYATARSGSEALAVFRSEGPFAIVISDMRMPGIDGATFLNQVRQLAPDTIRILLTGHADLESAIAAVNEGYIFRFLSKPCSAETLLKTIEAALEQYRLLTADRFLLEEKLERLSAQLLQAERLATLGTLAGGVGHELNNIASVFLSALHAVERSIKQQIMVSSEDFEDLVWVGEHLRLHASHLLELGRPRHESAVWLDIREVVEATTAILRVSGRTKQVEVVLSLPTEPLYVYVNRSRLEQILINLVGNAADALSEVSRPRKQVEIQLAWAPEAKECICSVSDNGIGIPEDKLGAIFEPYFTTKPPGKGTGLGLSVVKQIIEGYHGSISASSTQGVGSTFSVRLPASLSKPSSS
jgi:signal transduction histidine kinase